MILQELVAKKLAHPPRWLPGNCVYLTQMGSVAYGISTDASDMDLYGAAVPEKTVVFPHLTGAIPGFGAPPPGFECWQEHHVHDPAALGGKGRTYDFTVYSIVRYFALLMENNPNVLDSLFTPAHCVVHSTQIGNLMRENRRLFLHKGAYHKFRGYAFSQLHKMELKERGTEKVLAFEQEHRIEHRTTYAQVREEVVRREKSGALPGTPLGHLGDADLKLYEKLYADGIGASGRFENVKIFGFDTKFATHVMRLLDEAEQILTMGDIDIQRARDYLKAVRRGEVKPEEIRRVFSEKEKHLERVYVESRLPERPDEPRIRQLLLECLEHHYGSLEGAVVNPDQAVAALREVAAVIERNRGLIEG